MNIKINTLSIVLFGALLSGCTSGESPYGPASAASSSSNNIVSAKHFVLYFSELNPNVFETATSIVSQDVEVTVTVDAADRYDIDVTGGEVHFKTEVGTLDNLSCVLVDGSCSVIWTSVIEPSDVPADRINTITAYMTENSEEGFLDFNANGIFDDGDGNALTHDVSDPFLDLTHDGASPAYDPGPGPGTDILLLPRAFIAADGKYSGSGCARTVAPLCAATETTPIFDTQEMDLAY